MSPVKVKTESVHFQMQSVYSHRNGVTEQQDTEPVDIRSISHEEKTDKWIVILMMAGGGVSWMHQGMAFYHRGTATNTKSFVENCSQKNKTVNHQSILEQTLPTIHSDQTLVIQLQKISLS